jgi:Protein of unknown function (DUF1501)
MLSFHNQAKNCARSPRKNTRREFLRVGSLGLGGLSLTDLLALKAHGLDTKSLTKDRSVIFLFMHGGPSQFETFDPKMDAPSNIRSQTGEMATTIPGVTFGGTFEKLAKRAHLLNIVRSYVTGDGNHDIKPVVGANTLRANMGSLYSRVAGPIRSGVAMPTNVTLFPRAVHAEAGPAITDFGNFTSAGELGTAYSPFVPGAGGGLQEDMKLNLPATRLNDRRTLLAGLDEWKRKMDTSKAIEGSTNLQQQAFEAILNGVSDAFDLSQEDSKLVESYDTLPLANPDRINKKWNNHKHYADHGASIGKLLLLARRLCERGCGFVTITTSFVWDMHSDVNNAPCAEGMGYVGRPFDHAVAAFIDDVERRGLKDKILLVCCGEMGRTPKVNDTGGRDHWGNLAPLLLYGGGFGFGQVIGQSARDGGTPASDPIGIGDLTATIMHSLLDLDQVRVTGGLPQNLLNLLAQGTPIRGL